MKFRDRYELGKVLGEGAAGEVVEAVRRADGRPVAIKFMHGKDAIPQERGRFLEEIQLLKSVRSAYVVHLYDAGVTGGRLYYAMELVEGFDLGTHLHRRGGLPLEECLTLFHDVARGLQEIHSRGITHRDLKPANVMVTGEGRGKIADFGLAKGEGSRVRTKTGILLGTPGYMAPEVLQGGKADSRADLYALGILLFELRTGRRVFLEDNLGDLLRAQLEGPDEIDVELLDPGLQPLFLELVSQDPGARPDAGTVVARVRRILAGEGGGVDLPSGVGPPPSFPPGRGNPTVEAGGPTSGVGAATRLPEDSPVSAERSHSARTRLPGEIDSPPGKGNSAATRVGGAPLGKALPSEDPAPFDESGEPVSFGAFSLASVRAPRLAGKAPDGPGPSRRALGIGLGLGLLLLSSLLGMHLLAPGAPSTPADPGWVGEDPAESAPEAPAPALDLEALLPELERYDYARFLEQVIPVWHPGPEDVSHLSDAELMALEEARRAAVRELIKQVDRNVPSRPEELQEKPFLRSWPPGTRNTLLARIRGTRWYLALRRLALDLGKDWWQDGPREVVLRVLTSLTEMHRLNLLDQALGGKGTLLEWVAELLREVTPARLREDIAGPAGKTVPNFSRWVNQQDVRLCACQAITRQPEHPVLRRRVFLVNSSPNPKYCYLQDEQIHRSLEVPLGEPREADWVRLAVGLYDFMPTAVVRIGVGPRGQQPRLWYRFQTPRSSLTHVDNMVNPEWEARTLELAFPRRLLGDPFTELAVTITQEDVFDPYLELLGRPTTWVILVGVVQLSRPLPEVSEVLPKGVPLYTGDDSGCR